MSDPLKTNVTGRENELVRADQKLPAETGGDSVSIPAPRFPAFHAGDLAQALKGAYETQTVGNVEIITVAGPRYMPLKDALKIAIHFLEEYQASLPSPFHDDNPKLARSHEPAPPTIDIDAEVKG